MTLSNDPYYIPNNNLNNSNFFSICDKSQVKYLSINNYSG